MQNMDTQALLMPPIKNNIGFKRTQRHLVARLNGFGRHQLELKRGHDPRPEWEIQSEIAKNKYAITALLNFLCIMRGKTLLREDETLEEYEKRRQRYLHASDNFDYLFSYPYQKAFNSLRQEFGNPLTLARKARASHQIRLPLFDRTTN